MDSNNAPSTGWQERPLADEARRHAWFANQFAEVQARRLRRHDAGRPPRGGTFTAAHGTLEVLDGLPVFARHGLFQSPGAHEVWIRLSNGGLDNAPDATRFVRGLGMRVFGVHGASALGNGPASSQDFSLINQEVFVFPGSAAFVDCIVAASHGKRSLLSHLVSRYGLAAPRQLVRMLRAVRKAFGGFATDPLFSTLPIANGPYATRVRLMPSGANGKPAARRCKDWVADISARLAQRPLHWDLQLQFYVDDNRTPIEDASVNWSTPYTTVARLMVPQQEIDSSSARALARRMDATPFDPWHALAEHRPLGDVQRARKGVYFDGPRGGSPVGG